MMVPENQQQIWDRIDRICDAYERRLQAQEKPSLGEAVPRDWSSQLTERLLHELLELERVYGALRRAEVSGREYAEQFPEAGDMVERCLRRIRPRSQETTKAGTGTLTDRRDGPGEDPQGPPLRRLADYDLLEEIGRGGMGIVYRARHRRLGRIVALKAILAGEFASPHQRERFQTETRAAAQLDHPGIVPIYEVGESEGRPFCAMRLVSGTDLEEQVQQTLYEPTAAARLLQSLAQAVGYAHEQGILHRDLKPANVLLDETGAPQLTDFGLAKDLNLETTRDLTRSGQVLGTPSYMAPEQASGKRDRVGPATDIYALGAILYFMLTGRPPLRAPSVSETLLQVISKEPVSPRAFNAEIHRDLETICLKCLAKDPAGRYPTCQALAEDLGRYLAGRPITARPISSLARTARWCRRNPTPVGLLATSSLLLIAILAGIMYRHDSVTKTSALRTAQALASSRQETAETAHFYRLLQEAKSLAARHEPGWSWSVEQLLQEAERLPVAIRDPQLIRETLTLAKTHFDIRPWRTVADETLAGAVSFSPDGRYLALGDSVEETRPTIQVFSLSDLDTPQWTFSFDSEADTQRRIARGDAKVDNGIRALGFGPKHRYLAAGTRFGQVLVYDLEDPAAPPTTLEVLPDQEVSKVGFSHDGRLLFAMVNEQRLVQWEDFQNPVMVDKAVRDFACNPRGDDLVVLYRDKIEVRPSLDQPPERMDNHFGKAIEDGGRCALAPDGRTLAVEYQNAITLFDLRSGWRMPRLLRDGGLETTMAHSGVAFDGDLVIAPGDETVRLWNASSGALLYRIPASARHVAITALDPRGRYVAIRKGGPVELYELRRPRGRRLMSGILDRTTRGAIEDNVFVAAREAAWPYRRVRMMQWDCASGRDISEFLVLDPSGFDSRVSGNEAAARGPWRVVTARPLGLVAIKAGSGQPLRVQTLNEAGQSVSLDLDAVRDERLQPVPRFQRDDGVSVLRVAPKDDPTVLRVVVPEDQIPAGWTRLAVSVVLRWQRNAHGGEAVVGGHLRKVDMPIESGSPGARRPWGIREFASADAAMVVLHRDARNRFTAEIDARLELPGGGAPFDYVDIEGVLVSPLPAQADGTASKPALIDCVTIDPQHDHVWGVLADEYLAAWELGKTAPPRRWQTKPAGLSHIYDVKVGQQFTYTAARNGKIQLTDRDSGQLIKELPVSKEAVNQLDLGPEEAWMIVSGDAGRVERRALPSGALLETLVKKGHRVTAQALSGDGRWLALADASGLCSLWRDGPRGFEPYVELARYERPIDHLAFGPDGRYLAAVGRNRLASDVFDLQGLRQAFADYAAEE